MYTKVTIVNTGGTAVDKIEDISAAAKAIFSTIGVSLGEMNQGTSVVGRPIDKYYTHFEMPDGVKIPAWDLHKINTFQATSGNLFQCYFTEALLDDYNLCAYCLKTPEYCIHGKDKEGKKRMRSGGSSSRADAKRLAIARYDQRNG
jgi:hypothetical protein